MTRSRAAALAVALLACCLLPAARGQQPAAPRDNGVDRLVAVYQKFGLPLTTEVARTCPHARFADDGSFNRYPVTLDTLLSTNFKAATDPAAWEGRSIRFQAVRDDSTPDFTSLEDQNRRRLKEQYATWTPLNLVHRGRGFKFVAHGVEEVKYDRGESGPARGRATASATVNVLGGDRFIHVHVLAAGAATVLPDSSGLGQEPQVIPGPKRPREDDFFPPEPPPPKARPNPEYDALKAEAVRLATAAETKATAVARELADLDISAGGTSTTGTAVGRERPRGTLPGEARPSYGAALLALRVSVRLAPDDPTLDMDGNGTVDARDAAIIAKTAADQLGRK